MLKKVHVSKSVYEWRCTVKHSCGHIGVFTKHMFYNVGYLKNCMKEERQKVCPRCKLENILYGKD